MLGEFKELLGQSKSRGDTATILIAGVAGLTVDAGLNAIGFMSPGAVGAASASGALGIKKSWEARKDAKETAREAARISAEVQQAGERARKLHRFFEERDYRAGVDFMSAQMALHKDGIIDDEQLHAAVEDALKDFSASFERGSTPVPPVVGAPAD